MTSAALDEYVYRGHNNPHTAKYLWPKVESAFRECHRVLDVGCGTGEFSARLASLGHEVVGIDSSNSGIEAAKVAHPGIEFSVASAYDDLSFGLFDAVVALEVIEHCYSPRRLVRTMVRTLRPGGVLVVTTPYHSYLKNLLIALAGRCESHYDPLWDHGHVKFFSERSLRIVLSEAGVDGLRVHRVGRIPPLAMSMIAVGHI